MRSPADCSCDEKPRPPTALAPRKATPARPPRTAVRVVPSQSRTMKNSSEATPSSAPRDWLSTMA